MPRAPKSPATSGRRKTSYSDDDRWSAIAAVRLNGGNVHRTALALDIPHATLADWWKQFLESSENPQAKEKRGNLADKMESLIHSIVESMGGKIKNASLSQSAVAVGVLTDKVRILRGQGLEPDPLTELAKLLGVHRSQLPEQFQLAEGEEPPAEFFGIKAKGPIIDVQPEADNAPQPDSMHSSPDSMHVPESDENKDEASRRADDSTNSDEKLLESVGDDEIEN